MGKVRASPGQANICCYHGWELSGGPPGRDNGQNSRKEVRAIRARYTRQPALTFGAIYRLTNGACVELSGLLADSPGAGQDKELQVRNVTILGECDSEVSLT